MRKPWLLLLIFVGIKVILQVFAIDPVYELQRDEFLHLDIGKHLDWGYLSVPPLTALMSRIILLLGGTVFWIKLFPVVTGILLLFLIWKTVEILNGGVLAKILALAGVTFSVLVRLNTLYQPNSPDVFFWTLFFFLMVKYFQTEKPRWIYLAAVAAALGFLNKYNICFLLAGWIPGILITRQRRVLTSHHVYLAAGLGLVLILPNLIWQWINGFPVWHHMQELAGTQLIHVERVTFLKDQLLFFFGSIPVILVALLAFFVYPPFRRYTFLFWVMVFTLTIFTLLRAKSYYAIGLYPVFIAFGSVYLEEKLSVGWKKVLMIMAILLPPLFFIPLFRYIHPVMSPSEIMEHKMLFDKLGLSRWEDGKIHDIPQDFADMLGWKELAQMVDSAYQMVNSGEITIVHCDNYGQAGAVNFYSKSEGIQAYSMNADYINWYPLDQGDIRNAVLVKDRWDKDVNREKEKPYFEEIRYIGEISHPFAREKGTRVYLLKNAQISVNEILKMEISERKQKLRLK
jgi:hypothetical protein